MLDPKILEDEETSYIGSILNEVLGYIRCRNQEKNNHWSILTEQLANRNTLCGNTTNKFLPVKVRETAEVTDHFNSLRPIWL